ncbi:MULTISPECIES: hypothetical protein [Maribacter]|mgnify:FL=1|jgi:hypothetical protein|uniref:hypothetical protein n=1 Tax=Maribacter TaxID=252356 RepID=UPI000479AE44|nr:MULTISPECIES: hypothetical protein [Maribacter]|tara:strand:+ start:165 stop:1484 length:1320 start_codon:yes stop_codon:yes gene_type:complete
MSLPPETTSVVENKKNIKWLQRLKEESWEAELLVSAIAIFGTFQLFGLIEWATNKYIDLLPVEQYIYGYMIVFLGLLAISILVSMFVIHFVLRAYWIGLVGLNSVFPDYSIEDSVYSRIYTEKILAILPKQEDTIRKVDDLCSVIFSSAFTILLIYTYMSLFLSIYMLIYNMLLDYIPSYILLIPLFIILSLLVLQMIFSVIGNLKKYKNNVRVQTWMFKLVRLTSMVTYGPLYRNLLQVSMVFGSNFKKKKSLVYLVLAFFASGIFLTLVKFQDTNIPHLILPKNHDVNLMYLSYYSDQNSDESFLLTPQIQSDIIVGETVKLFIPIFHHERNYQAETCGEYQEDDSLSSEEERVKSRKFYLDCYEKYHKVTLNGTLLNINFLKKDHAVSEQFGIVGFIDKELLKKGNNTLVVTKTLGVVKKFTWSIPFYYQPNTLQN